VSGADAITTPLINTDFDGDARSATTRDIGADEFAGISPAPVITKSDSTGCCIMYCHCKGNKCRCGAYKRNLNFSNVKYNYNGTAKHR